MCLGIPGRVTEWVDRDPMFARARVEFAGVTREIHMACASGAEVGDYVIVHAGIAISIINEEEAQQTLDALKMLADLDSNAETAG